MRDGSSWVEPVLSYDKCVLLKDHNAVMALRLEPAALRSRVKHSTTEPLRSPINEFALLNPCPTTVGSKRRSAKKFVGGIHDLKETEEK